MTSFAKYVAIPLNVGLLVLCVNTFQALSASQDFPELSSSDTLTSSSGGSETSLISPRDSSSNSSLSDTQFQPATGALPTSESSSTKEDILIDFTSRPMEQSERKAQDPISLFRREPTSPSAPPPPVRTRVNDRQGPPTLQLPPPPPQAGAPTQTLSRNVARPVAKVAHKRGNSPVNLSTPSVAEERFVPQIRNQLSGMLPDIKPQRPRLNTRAVSHTPPPRAVGIRARANSVLSPSARNEYAQNLRTEARQTSPFLSIIVPPSAEDHEDEAPFGTSSPIAMRVDSHVGRMSTTLVPNSEEYYESDYDYYENSSSRSDVPLESTRHKRRRSAAPAAVTTTVQKSKHLSRKTRVKPHVDSEDTTLEMPRTESLMRRRILSVEEALAPSREETLLWKNPINHWRNPLNPSSSSFPIPNGSLLSFCGGGAISTQIRTHTKETNEWGLSHVGIALVGTAQEMINMAEQTYVRGILQYNPSRKMIKAMDHMLEHLRTFPLDEPDVFCVHSTGEFGVHFRQLSSLLLDYDGQVYLRPLFQPIPLKDMYHVLVNNLGKMYNFAPMDFVRAINDRNKKTNNITAFCSQLTTTIYQHCNLIPMDIQPLNVAPAEFGSDCENDLLRGYAPGEVVLKFKPVVSGGCCEVF
ncbi:MAG: hypothetical protein LBF66_02380 [Holosporales bacterium]|nr:hypothetical protein [Holosporales bacterium]